MLSDRIRQAKDSYINTMPHISIDRARIWTESHQRTEGMATPIRRAMAFKDTCQELGVHIFEGELIVGALGEYRKCGVLTPEFSWSWVDREMDRFAERPQDPYAIEPEQKAYLREHIFPYWAGKSLEESFLQQVDPEAAKVTVDTSIVDNDSKWRQSVGEITPDYQEVLFVKGFGGIIQEARAKLESLSPTKAEDLDKRTFYRSVILAAEGIICLANRYADRAEALAKEASGARRNEFLTIAANCRRVPEHPPTTFWEALQFVWFTQLGGILAENPLAQKLHRDQAPRPFLSATLGACLENGRDLVDCGAEYNVGPVITSMGIAVCANALYAIKHLVFDEKTVSAEDLHQALEADWAGHEVLRQKILNLPKYGNNIDAVDRIAVKIANHQYEAINSYTDINGNAFKSAFMGISNYLPTGKILGASPDGRHARAPISEGVSPYAGTDQSTPLAAMRSAAKLNQDVHSGGTLMNLRMSPSLVNSPRGRANLGHMIKSFFNLGGFHVQFNTVSNETLYAAQKNPENYRDLLVRVAGYSTQFVNLSRSMQDAIIDRNSHDSF
ncbi:pyruvate formate lyase family protein [Peptococcus simiae]|uniref:pyruvate formate lyase family protein n=1 Tax=Peptococcus simiae TaxID=1643805 RepID=UPI00397EF13C